ncbi:MULTISPECIES: aldose epimerase [Paenibacillus]|uniref:Aldose epimerase n=1 Tax=Paenibacillus validus TaxID=44253 RepID=A0A7X2Z7F2_9BACL|nr:aldose epimerase [Paenibacillus validus]MUG69733.1 aldose epimerase [Paenibacillus validus]
MSGYSIRTYEDTYTVYELKEADGDAWFRIVPERGGIVTSYGTAGVERLYLDRATLLDPSANIRGGIPVLFPVSGYITDNRYEWKGTPYSMKNHGVARNHPWRVEKTGDDNGVYITLSLRANEETLASFPFDFELSFTYRLLNGTLTIEQQYSNHSAEPMPMYPGFHPYFLADRKAVRYDIDADRYYDFNDHREKPYEGEIDLDQLPESVVFLEAKEPRIGFTFEGRQVVEMTYSEAFRYVVLWSIQDKPFICVEPWMAMPDELNRKQELTYVPAGGVVQAVLAITSKSGE